MTPDGWGVRKGEDQPSRHGAADLHQPSAIQNTCSRTDISATQTTFCARHLLAVHGVPKRQEGHEAGGHCKAWGANPTVVTPVHAPRDPPSAASG